jgi:hypothetical protein
MNITQLSVHTIEAEINNYRFNASTICDGSIKSIITNIDTDEQMFSSSEPRTGNLKDSFNAMIEFYNLFVENKLENSIDRKFIIHAKNPINGNEYTHENSILLSAKDLAVIPALKAYLAECKKLNATPEHLKSFKMLIERVTEFQKNNKTKVPDTKGEEVERCTKVIKT